MLARYMRQEVVAREREEWRLHGTLVIDGWLRHTLIRHCYLGGLRYRHSRHDSH